jgi:hypothetical protein
MKKEDNVSRVQDTFKCKACPVVSASVDPLMSVGGTGSSEGKPGGTEKGGGAPPSGYKTSGFFLTAITFFTSVNQPKVVFL